MDGGNDSSKRNGRLPTTVHFSLHLRAPDPPRRGSSARRPPFCGLPGDPRARCVVGAKSSMASIKQEQALGAVAPAVPEEQQSTAADDVVAPGSTQAPLVGKPLGQLPGDRVGIDIISPTPTVGNGASCSQPVPTPAVPGPVGTYIGCVPGTAHSIGLLRPDAVLSCGRPAADYIHAPPRSP